MPLKRGSMRTAKTGLVGEMEAVADELIQKKESVKILWVNRM